MMEVAIFRLSNDSEKENCQKINKLTAGVKKNRLSNLLIENGLTDANNALGEFFEVAERNNWVHGHILNPNGDFSKLTRLRITTDDAGIVVNNIPVTYDHTSFEEFYESWEKFRQEFNLEKAECDQYILKIQET